MDWKNLSHVRAHWLAYCRSSSKPCMMNSAKINPKIWWYCSRTCLGVRWLHFIFTPDCLVDTMMLVVLSKAGGAFYWINGVPAGAVTARCWEITSYPLQFSQPLHFYAEFLFAAWHWCLMLLCVDKQLVCSTSKWATLHPRKKAWIRRRYCIHPVWSIAVLIWVCRGLLERCLWKFLNVYCSFFSSVPLTARIHTHSRHIFCHSVGTVVLPAWVLLQSDGEEGRKAAAFSVRWSLVNKCK